VSRNTFQAGHRGSIPSRTRNNDEGKVPDKREYRRITIADPSSGRGAPEGDAGASCAGSEEAASRVDRVEALPDDGLDEAFVPEDRERLLGSDVADAVFLAECLKTGKSAAECAAVDLPPEQVGKLQVERPGGGVIKSHVVTLGSSRLTAGPRVSMRNHMVPVDCVWQLLRVRGAVRHSVTHGSEARMTARMTEQPLTDLNAPRGSACPATADVALPELAELADGLAPASALRALAEAGRDLLRRTAELPDTERELLSVLGEYRYAVFAFTAAADRL
jgi:hypothetical protein